MSSSYEIPGDTTLAGTCRHVRRDSCLLRVPFLSSFEGNIDTDQTVSTYSLERRLY
jgi:hypothetical protein